MESVTDKTPLSTIIGEDPSLKASFHGMDDGATFGTFVDHVVENAGAWVRGLPLDKASGLRKVKAAVLRLTGASVPEDLTEFKAKLIRMEKTVKACMTNAKLKDMETEKSAAPDPARQVAEKLKAAILTYCEATDQTGALAMLECMLGDNDDVETLESVFRHVAADDPAALGAFNVLRP